jgi:hypothetical protein
MNFLLGLAGIWTSSYTEEARQVTVEINFSVFRRVISGSGFISSYHYLSPLTPTIFSLSSLILHWRHTVPSSPTHFFVSPHDLCNTSFSEGSAYTHRVSEIELQAVDLEISCTEKHFSLYFIWHIEQLCWEMRCFSFLEIFRHNWCIRNVTLLTGISLYITTPLHLIDTRKESIKRKGRK